jgi:hypothetical protein
MTSPVTVSLQVPYADTEQQFLVLAVQTAVRTFRSMNSNSGESCCSSSSRPSGSSSSLLDQDALKKR